MIEMNPKRRIPGDYRYHEPLPRIDIEENDQSYSFNRNISVLGSSFLKLGSVTFPPKAAPSDTRGGWATRKKEEKV